MLLIGITSSRAASSHGLTPERRRLVHEPYQSVQLWSHCADVLRVLIFRLIGLHSH
jgi:hypothetical protein